VPFFNWVAGIRIKVIDVLSLLYERHDLGRFNPD